MKKGRIAISLICATALTSVAMLPAFAASEPDDVPAAAIGHACAINTNATFAASDEIMKKSLSKESLVTSLLLAISSLRLLHQKRSNL